MRVIDGINVKFKRFCGNRVPFAKDIHFQHLNLNLCNRRIIIPKWSNLFIIRTDNEILVRMCNSIFIMNLCNSTTNHIMKLRKNTKQFNWDLYITKSYLLNIAAANNIKDTQFHSQIPHKIIINSFNKHTNA